MFPNLTGGVDPSNIFQTRAGRDYIMSFIESNEQAIDILNTAKLKVEIARSKQELNRIQAGETQHLELETDDEVQEKRVLKRLLRKLIGQTKVFTPAMRIDRFIATEVIEVKPFPSGKAALGQVLASAHYYPKHSKRIHLFRVVFKHLPKVQEVCQQLGVTVTNEGRKGK
jgi:hypothetical protein